MSTIILIKIQDQIFTFYKNMTTSILSISFKQLKHKAPKEAIFDGSLKSMFNLGFCLFEFVLFIRGARKEASSFDQKKMTESDL